MLLADKVINIALGQVGTIEGKNNWNKYAKDLDEIKFFNYSKQNSPWCSVFVAWCVWTASDKNKDKALAALYQPKKDNCGASCKYAAKYYREHKAWSKTPVKGSQIFFGDAGAKEGEEEHTGLVVSVGVSTLQTVEGNKNNKVSKCSYSLKDSRIIGYGLIKYDTTTPAEPQKPQTPQTDSKPEPSQGDKTDKGYQEYKVKTNSGCNLRIREKPTTKSKKLGSIPQGKIVKVFDILGNWAKIEYKGIKGYSSKKYLIKA